MIQSPAHITRRGTFSGIFSGYTVEIDLLNEPTLRHLWRKQRTLLCEGNTTQGAKRNSIHHFRVIIYRSSSTKHMSCNYSRAFLAAGHPSPVAYRCDLGRWREFLRKSTFNSLSMLRFELWWLSSVLVFDVFLISCFAFDSNISQHFGPGVLSSVLDLPYGSLSTIAVVPMRTALKRNCFDQFDIIMVAAQLL